MLELNKDLRKRLDTYCLVTGKSEEEAITEALDNLTTWYMTDEDCPKKAKYTPVQLVNMPPIPAKGCWVLNSEGIFGLSYFRIVLDGRMTRVPASCISFD